jgi:hypothetical protein
MKPLEITINILFFPLRVVQGDKGFSNYPVTECSLPKNWRKQINSEIPRMKSVDWRTYGERKENLEPTFNLCLPQRHLASAISRRPFVSPPPLFRGSDQAPDAEWHNGYLCPCPFTRELSRLLNKW